MLSFLWATLSSKTITMSFFKLPNLQKMLYVVTLIAYLSLLKHKILKALPTHCFQHGTLNEWKGSVRFTSYSR